MAHTKESGISRLLCIMFHIMPTVVNTNCYCDLPRTVQNRKQINTTNKKGYYKIFKSPLHFALQLLGGAWQTKIYIET
jgi:hypothetical protein